MKKLLGGLCVLGLASQALAIVPTLGSSAAIPGGRTLVPGVDITMSFIALDTAPSSVDRHAGNDMFRAMDGPYGAFAASTNLGYDDYFGLTAPFGPGDIDGNSPLDEFGFIGGVTTAGMSLQFQFYNGEGDLTDFVNVGPFPQGGNFNWTITSGPDTHPPFSPPMLTIANHGYVQIVGVTPADTGRWFLSTTAPTIGSQVFGPGEGSHATNSHRFRLDVPEPASMALLALGGLFAARRRK